MRRSSALALAVCLAAVPACAAILGDDFVVVDDDDNDNDNDNDNDGTTSSNPSSCDEEIDCGFCLDCECPVEAQACVETACYVLNDCLLAGCPAFECDDVCGFPDEWGAAELEQLRACGCGTCGDLCDC